MTTISPEDVKRELSGSIYTVYVKYGPDWLPVGYITDSYKPCEEWRGWPDECNPCRNGFKARVTGSSLSWQGPFTDYRDAEQYLMDHNPYETHR